MPNIKSQKKRVLTNDKKHMANAAQRSELKTAIKNVIAAVDANDKAAAIAAYNHASSKLDKAISSGIHHKNYAKMCIRDSTCTLSQFGSFIHFNFIERSTFNLRLNDLLLID